MIQPDIQQEVANEVNTRLSRATKELGEKYARGEGGQDASVDGPSGNLYKEKHAAELKAKKERKQRTQGKNTESEGRTRDNDDDERDDEADDGDDDYELRNIREQRLRQIKQQQNEKLENLSKGHGQYREILQDEFLAEVTGSLKVICHFYHRDFPRCEILNHHLQILATKHIESKFIKVNAEKAPFFIEKLRIRTIPTIVIFQDGVAIDKMIGFEELSEGLPEGKEDEWPTVKLARVLASKQAINKALIVDEEAIEKQSVTELENLRKAMIYDSLLNLDDELDLDDE